jgi:protease I
VRLPHYSSILRNEFISTSESDSASLDGTTVAVVVAPDGSEAVEVTDPKRAVSEVGASVDVVSTDDGEAETVDNDLEPAQTVEIDERVADVSADEYDALLLPGGTVGADRLRADDEVVEFVRDHVERGDPTGAICHGPWTLVEAGVVDGRTLTSYPSLQTDVRNAGGEWVDEEVVTDDGLVTSRKPEDLSAFCDAVVDEFAARSD